MKPNFFDIVLALGWCAAQFSMRLRTANIEAGHKQIVGHEGHKNHF